jgi:PEP-CTERM motif
MTNITLRVLGAALLSAGLFSVTAQAATIGQVDASITGLRYRLIDLDLEDGITPTLSVSGELSAASAVGQLAPYYGGFYFAENASDTTTAPVFGESGILTLTNNPIPGTSATLGSVISTSSSLDSELWNSALSQNSESYSYNSTGYDNEGVLYNSVNTFTTTSVSGAQGFRTEALGESLLTINGKALLVIEGTAMVSTLFDRSTLIAAAASVPDYSNGNGQTTGAVNLLLAQSVTTVLPGNTVSDSGSGSSFSLSAAVDYSMYAALVNNNNYGNGSYTEDITGGTGDTQNFQLSFAHLGEGSTDLFFNVFVGSTVTQQFQGYTSQTVVELGDPVEVVTPPVVVPSIPEPGTYALMGLGLLGMAAAVRRSRRVPASV